jgi:rSAM/selenodomain-associated transferase 2
MSLSIIIPCLNESAVIGSALDALRPYRQRGAEVLVVDGGSSDDTLVKAREGADRLLNTARGRALQMNAGAKVARGTVLLFLHADCRLPADADLLIREGLQRAGKKWGRFDVRLSSRFLMLRIVGELMNLRSRASGIATGDQGIFVDRTLFEAVGGFPEIPLMEDIELSRRLKRHERPLCIPDPVTVSARRWEKHGVLRTILLMWRLRLAYWCGANPQTLALRYAPHRE